MIQYIHFKPFAHNSNVRCLNGSAHAHYSSEIDRVTCPLCLDPNHKKEHWAIVQEEYRTKNKRPLFT
jgi:hypothetical protein